MVRRSVCFTQRLICGFLLAGILVPSALAQAPRPVLFRQTPIYPVLARKMHIYGTVTLLLTVLDNGTVSEVVVKKGHPLLRDAALQAGRRWRFAPAPGVTFSMVDVIFDPVF